MLSSLVWLGFFVVVVVHKVPDRYSDVPFLLRQTLTSEELQYTRTHKHASHSLNWVKMERERKDPSLRLLPVQPALTLYISFFSSWRFFLSFFLFIPFSFLSRFLFLSSSLTIFSFFFSWATFLPSRGFGARTRSLFQIMNKRSFSAFLYRWLLYYYYAFCCEGGPFFYHRLWFFLSLPCCTFALLDNRHSY